MRDESSKAAVSITSVGQSRESELAHRRRTYGLMMLVRVLCVIGAVFSYALSPWLSLAMVVGGAILPWCAVLIANDRPVKRTPPAREALRRTEELALGAAPDERTVDL